MWEVEFYVADRAKYQNTCYIFMFYCVCDADKRFAVMARLNGMLPVTVGLFKRCQSDHHAVVTVLGVIKILAGNGEIYLFVFYLNVRSLFLAAVLYYYDIFLFLLFLLLLLLLLLQTSATNAEYLGKHGSFSNISKMFDGAARKNYIILK